MRTPVAPSVLRFARRALLVAPLLAAAACASAAKRYEQGVELEQRGRPADAARRYIDALEKEPGLEDARRRLQDTGDRAVAEYLAESAAHQSAGADDEAADVLLRLDDLARDARRVGVALAVPADYPQHRRATLDRAIQAAVRDANGAGARGDFDAALGRLDRAVSRWEPGPAQRGEIDRARFDAQVSWAQAELAGGRFRSAYERAGRAAELYGQESAATQIARRVQDEALRRGTVRVAVLPVAALRENRQKLPDDFFPALDEELETNHWQRAPLFVEVVDRRGPGRPRRHGYGRPPLTTREAAQLGLEMGAELVVVAEVDSVASTDAGVQATRRAARTRAGADTAYTVREGRREVWTRVSWAIIDMQTRALVDRGHVTAEGGARFREGVFAGDPRTLALSREERDLFDPEARGEVEDELVRELVTALSSRLERAVYDRVLREVD